MLGSLLCTRKTSRKMFYTIDIISEGYYLFIYVRIQNFRTPNLPTKPRSFVEQGIVIVIPNTAYIVMKA